MFSDRVDQNKILNTVDRKFGKFPAKNTVDKP